MFFQSPKSFNKNSESEYFSLSQLHSCYKYNSSFSKYYVETPQNNIFINYDIDNSFNKDTQNKRIPSSIKQELKHSSNNISLLNTPKFEKVCYNIFFPKDDLFLLSSSKISPKKLEFQKIQKPSMIHPEENNNNNNNINHITTKSEQNKNYSSSQIKKNKNINANINNNCSFDAKSNNNSIKINKNKKYKNELRAILKGINQLNKTEKKEKTSNVEPEEISSNSSTKAKTRIVSEAKIKNKKKNVKNIIIKNVRYSKRAKKYNILPEELKKELLFDAKYMKTIDVAKKYGISTRNINRWKKKGIKRKRGSGRKYKDPELEKKIIIWYNFQDKKNVTAKNFRDKALELSNNESFRASSGWLTILKKKYKIKFKKN